MIESNLTGVAPSDALPRAPWPTWKKLMAYVVLSAVSLGAIWFVDLKVHRPAVMPRSESAGR